MMFMQGAFKKRSMGNRAGGGLIFVLLAVLCLSACGENTSSLEDRMQRAVAWQSEGDLKAAVIELKNALLSYPDSGDARLLLGRIYLELGKGADAEKEIEKAATSGIPESNITSPLVESWLLQRKYDNIIERVPYEPGNAGGDGIDNLSILGTAHLGRGDITTAQTYFDEILALAPGNIRALVGKARVSFIRKDDEDTLKYISLAEAILPNNQELLQLKASRSWLAKDYKAVEVLYGKLVELYPGHLINEVYLAWIKLINGKSAEAGETLVKFREMSPDHGLVNFVSALHAVTEKDYAAAKDYAEKALLRAPGDLRTKFIAATATFALGENEQSFAYIQQYLKAVPGDVKAKELLLRLQVRMNKNKEAYDTLKDVSSQSEDKEKFLNILASYELRVGDIEQARLHLEQSLDENPGQLDSRQKLAMLKISGGDIEGGLKEMEKALAGIPDDYKRRMQRARTLIIAKQFPEAVQICQDLQEMKPDNINGFLCEGTAYYKGDNKDKALTALMTVLAKRPGNLVATRLVIAIHLEKDDLEKATDVQGQYLKIHPDDAKSTFGMHLLKVRAGKKDEAAEYLKKSVKLDPNARVSVLALARHYLSSGEAEEALAVSDKIMPLYSKSDGLLEVRGKAQMTVGRYNSAVRTFENLVQVKPDNSAALLLLASAYDGTNDYGKLEKTAQKILTLQPANARARIYLAKVEASRGKWQKADDILAKIKGDLGDDAEYSTLRGRINLVNKNYPQAIFFLEKSFRAEENMPNLLQLVSAYRLSGEIDTAITLMEDWHAKHPEDMIVTVSLGDYYLENKAYAKADAKYAVVLEKHPGQSAVLNNLAWSLYKQDRLDEALSNIRKAREISPDMAAFLDTEAEILLAKKDVKAAVRQYRKAVDKAPDALHFKYHLARALVEAGEKAEAIEMLKNLKRDGRPFEGLMAAFDLLEKLEAE